MSVSLSTYAEQASHYAAVRSRLMNAPRLKPIVIPAPKIVNVDYPMIAGPYRPGELGHERILFPHVKAFVSSHGRYFPRGMAKWMAVAKEVCAWHGIDYADAVSGVKTNRLVACRSEIWWYCHTRLDVSLSALGRAFDKDHTTVLWGVRQHMRKVKEKKGRSNFPHLGQVAQEEVVLQ